MQAEVSETAELSSSPRSRLRSRLMNAIAVVAAAGDAISVFSFYRHVATSKTSFCDFGTSFNCDVVNRSSYSTFGGIPVALVGVLGYVLILALSTLYRDKAETPGMLLIASVAGLAFSLYLTYIEKFVLATWCILCLGSLAAILIATILSAILFRTMTTSRQN